MTNFEKYFSTAKQAARFFSEKGYNAVCDVCIKRDIPYCFEDEDCESNILEYFNQEAD